MRKKPTPVTVGVRADSTETYTQLATRIPKALHRALKLHVVEHGGTVMGFVVDALRERLTRKKAA